MGGASQDLQDCRRVEEDRGDLVTFAFALLELQTEKVSNTTVNANINASAARLSRTKAGRGRKE